MVYLFYKTQFEMNLKSFLVLVLVSFFMSNFSFAQQGEVNVNGSSSYMEYPKATILYLTISDVQPNEYKRTRYKKMETVLQEFKDNLTLKGITAKLEKDNKYNASNNYYDGITTIELENYFITLKSEADANLVKRALTEGVRITNVNFLYDPITNSKKNELIDKALANAQENANYLAKKLNRKLGAIKSVSSQNYVDHQNNLERPDRQITHIQSFQLIFELL